MRLHKTCTLETQRSALISLFLPLTNLNISFFNNAAPSDQPFQVAFYCPYPPSGPLVKMEKTKLNGSEVRRKIGKTKIKDNKRNYFRHLYIIKQLTDVLSAPKEKLAAPFPDHYTYSEPTSAPDSKSTQDGLDFYK